MAVGTPFTGITEKVLPLQMTAVWLKMLGLGLTVTTQLPVDGVNVVLQVLSLAKRTYVVVAINPVGGS